MKHIYSGKVRDIYDIGDEQLLFVASDRISAFDVVLPQAVPDKGRVLTAFTDFWLGELKDLAPSHLISTDPSTFPAEANEIADVAGRAMLVRKSEMLPIECIVRGYLSGTAWKEYQQSGTMHGEPLPRGLQQSSRLPEPVFTPSTKADAGHDLNITFDKAVDLVGTEVAEKARTISVEAYRRAAELALAQGIVIADTKFELGFIDGELAICDEVLTPDSSRFWPRDSYAPGHGVPSFDKQFVRDYLEDIKWNKQPPVPSLPEDVVQRTREKYIEAFRLLSGRELQ